MAHKGKLFPVFDRRDLSLAPNYLARLPLAWRYFGYAGTGPLAPLVNGTFVDMDIIYEPLVYEGRVVYSGSKVVAPGLTISAFYDYRVTHTEQMAEHHFEFAVAAATRLVMTFRPLTDSWPYVALVPPLSGGADPSYVVTTYGVVRPKQWAEF